jgi:hypothetical protein
MSEFTIRKLNEWEKIVDEREEATKEGKKTDKVFKGFKRDQLDGRQDGWKAIARNTRFSDTATHSRWSVRDHRRV